MRKIFLAAIAAMTVISACQKNDFNVPASEESVLNAVIEDVAASKTIMDEDNNILWLEGDQIIAFMKTSLGLKYQLKDEYAGRTSGYFSKVYAGNGDDLGAGMEQDHIVAYYPYSETIGCTRYDDDYALDVVLPLEQTFEEESFANGFFPMVAVSEDNDITFSNVCGGMKLQITGTQKVVSVTVEGNNGEKLSGEATVIACTDESKPAITMAESASASVTLDCGDGVQLNEYVATEFIIVLPPVTFSQGFTVTVTGSEGETYTVGTDKENTVLRSSLLVMPSVEFGSVRSVALDHESVTLPTQFSCTLAVSVVPEDAVDRSVVWSSDNTSVASVDQSGVITTLSAGTANITAEAGGLSATCAVEVVEPTPREVKEYIVDGVSYGMGIAVGDVVWAPVNCGYEAPDGDYKGYPYGKMYQWGRKYGQGYSTDYDASVPEAMDAPSSDWQDAGYANNYFIMSQSPNDWMSPQDNTLWNSGTEDVPVKTSNDPCPEGWRVPTSAEILELGENSSEWITDADSRSGRYFSGIYTYFENSSQVFLPAAGSLMYSPIFVGLGLFRDSIANYWTSVPGIDNGTKSVNFNFSKSVVSHNEANRVNGYPVRCVQE